MTTSDRTVTTFLEAAEQTFHQPASASDTLFDLGADSMSTVEFLLLLEERLGTTIDPELLMSGDPLGELAAAVRARAGE
jgi:acyl carrier protein